jgi:hypothetical protein
LAVADEAEVFEPHLCMIAVAIHWKLA